MKSRNIGYIPEIDHLRLLAALLVFGYHFSRYYLGNWQPIPDAALLGLLTEGHTGVSLFFVLSGFIFMSIALAGDAIDYRSFLRNRVLRIAPLFLVVFVVAISIARDEFEPADLFYVLFTNLGDAPTSRHFATGPAWSISLEFTFYLVFPYLAAFAKDGSAYLLKLVALLLVVKAIVFLASDNGVHTLYSTLPGRFDQFLIGMLAAILYSRRREWLQRWGGPLLVLALVSVLLGAMAQARWASFLSTDQQQPVWIFMGTIEAVLWAAVIVAYIAARISLPGWLDTALSRGGSWSFSFYMWHAMVIFLAHETVGAVGGTGPLALVANGAVILALTLAFAWLSFTTIEKPFLDLRRRYVDRTTSVGAG